MAAVTVALMVVVVVVVAVVAVVTVVLGRGVVPKAAEAIHTVIHDLLVILQKQVPLNR